MNDEEFSRAKKKNPNLKQKARLLLEYGESRDGYFTCDKFMSRMLLK